MIRLRFRLYMIWAALTNRFTQEAAHNNVLTAYLWDGQELGKEIWQAALNEEGGGEG